MSNNGNSGRSNGNGNGHRPSSWASLFGRKRDHGEEPDPYRRLALQIHYDSVDGKQDRSVMLTAPERSPACAQASIGLACSLVKAVGRPVLLIDANPGPHSVTELMHSPASAGFCDLISNPLLDPAGLILPTTHENLAFLPAGNASSLSPQSALIAARLPAISADYDFVLIAGGGALSDSLSRALAPFVGCVLLLGVENETTVDDLDAAQNALLFGNARRVALVLSTPGSRS